LSSVLTYYLEIRKKANQIANWFLTKPLITVSLFFLFLFLFTLMFVYQRYVLFREIKNKEISRILFEVKNNIEQSLKSNYIVSLNLALLVGDDGQPKNFETVAANLIRQNPHIHAVELVPDGVIRYVYPLKGNEEALNLDLYKSDPINAVEARKAIERKQMYYQGPVELQQKGTGLIGRLPVFHNDKFWGFSAVVIKLETFFRSAGIDNTRYRDYRFQFSKVNPLTGKEDFFLDFKREGKYMQSEAITFPDGNWRLYVTYINKYEVWWQLLSTIFFGIGLAALSSYLLYRLIIKQKDLQHMFWQQGRVLVHTESKFKGIFDHAAIGIARVNSRTGMLLEVNRYLCEFSGYSAEELMHKKIKSLIHPDDVATESRLFKLLVKGEIREIKDEKRYVCKNGSVKWGNVIITPLWERDESPTNHIVILEDSTARREAAEGLIESQHRIQSLINTIDGVVWESYLDTFESIFISKKIEDILGYSQKEWQSHPDFWVEHLHPEDRPRIMDYMRTSLPESKQLDGEYRIFAKDGSVVWIRDIVTVVEEPGRRAKLRGIMIDVTRQKHAEAALQDSLQLVTDQNKRLLDFSYIVSHNLRSHAGNIQGITELIDNAESDEERSEMIRLLKMVAINLNETLFNLNNVINIQSSIDIEVEPLSLHEYIQRTISALNTQILDKKAVIVNEIPERVRIHYNRAYLESILLNLISNAIRYGNPHREPVIRLVWTEENGSPVFSIADNGIGIDLNRNREKVFGMYQTFNGNPDARGFGLFITKNQVEAMGGKIEVESKLNEGTTFKLYFSPLREQG